MKRRKQYDGQYGGMPPHVAGSDTSEAAAQSMADKALTVRERVFLEIARQGLRGATCDEIEQALRGRHQTISARVRELRNARRVVDTGVRRRTTSGRLAAVFVDARLAPPDLLDEDEGPAIPVARGVDRPTRRELRETLQFLRVMYREWQADGNMVSDGFIKTMKWLSALAKPSDGGAAR